MRSLDEERPVEPRHAPSIARGHLVDASDGTRRTSMRRLISVLIGVVVALLGLFWTLQGAGVVHVRPILCVSHCKPVTKSNTWLLVGAITCAAGGAIAARERAAHESQASAVMRVLSIGDAWMHKQDQRA